MAPEDDARNVRPASGIRDKTWTPGIARGKMRFAPARIETMKQEWPTIPGKAENQQQLRGRLLVEAVVPQSQYSRRLEVSLQAVASIPIAREMNRQIVCNGSSRDRQPLDDIRPNGTGQLDEGCIPYPMLCSLGMTMNRLPAASRSACTRREFNQSS